MRMPPIPAGVAVGEGGRTEAVREDREPDREVDSEHDQVLVGKLRFLDHDSCEYDRCQTAGPEPAEEPRVGGRARVPHIAMATGTIRTTVRLRSA